MHEAAASSTALATALMRSLHSRLNPQPLIDDRWGERLVPEEVRRQFDEARLLASPAFPNVITRTRYAEDALQAAVARGARQYVLIGAGFDSFCLRRPRFAEQLEIFEIDHPATQGLKIRRLEACGVCLPPSVHFLAADLAQRSVAEVLANSPFDSHVPSFFSWLGVSMYLTLEANRATLRAIAACAPPGSELAFTYLEAARLRSPSPAFEAMQQRVSAKGEPFLSGFDPDSLAAELAGCGFKLIEDLTGADALARYGRTCDRSLAKPSSSHIALARVKAGAPFGPTSARSVIMSNT
jgi:methyltransferase (TIGR00027 family)